MKREIDAQTSLIGLFGNPVEHSLSPLFMNHALWLLRLNYRYIAFNVEGEKLRDAVESLRILGFAGCNITLPHKTAVMDSLDSVDEQAQTIGAVNCIVNRSGRLTGYNTDHLGFVKPLQDRRIRISNEAALVIGCGGAAKGALFALTNTGVGSISLINRTEENAKKIIHWCEEVLGYKSCFYKGKSEQISQRLVEQTRLIVNTTPVGMFPGIEECPIPDRISFHPEQCVYDMVYNPWKTRLLKKAHKDGATIINGFEMLITQGLSSLELWFPEKAEEIFSRQREILSFARERAAK